MAGPTDIALRLVDARALSIWRPVATERAVATGGRRVRVADFATVSGRDSLAQALVMRLLTPQGELAALGHATYGSRLHEIVGAPNTETTRNLAKLHVIAALKAERRVAKVVAVDGAPHPASRELITIAATVRPVGEAEALALAPILVEL